jgi:hypothetical protein
MPCGKSKAPHVTVFNSCNEDLWRRFALLLFFTVGVGDHFLFCLGSVFIKKLIKLKKVKKN